MADDDNEPSTHANGGSREFWKQHSLSPDTTQKRPYPVTPPVDTVRLKSDMHKDEDASQTLNDLDARGVARTKSSLLSDQPLYRGADALADRALARKDTLNQARAGKIPAKKNP